MTAPAVLSLTDPQTLDALVTLLHKQRDLFAQLRELSSQQATLVSDGSADALLGVLAQRQTIINELTGANDELEPFRRDWTRLYAELTESQRRQVGGLLQEVQDALAAILEQDERDRQSLQAQQSEIGGELKSMARAGSAAQAYRGAPQPINPRFADHQG